MTAVTTVTAWEQRQCSRRRSRRFTYTDSFVPVNVPISQMRKPGTEHWNQSRKRGLLPEASPVGPDTIPPIQPQEKKKCMLRPTSNSPTSHWLM